MRKSILIVALLAIGCGPYTVQPSAPPEPNKPVVKKINFAELVSDLADSIDNRETLPKNTMQLELMVKHLRSVQAITDEHVALLKAAVDFSKHAELTKADSEKIRGLK